MSVNVMELSSGRLHRFRDGQVVEISNESYHYRVRVIGSVHADGQDFDGEIVDSFHGGLSVGAVTRFCTAQFQ